MAYNAYLKIDGITGESTEAYAGWIEILSWSWGATQPSERMATGTGAGKAGTPSFQAITIGKRIDSTSPLLLSKCLSGKVIPNVRLETTQDFQKVGGLPVVQWKLSNVLVSAIRPSQLLVASDLSGGGQQPYAFPVEALTLNFAKFAFAYNGHKVDGSTLPVVRAGWDVKLNKITDGGIT